MKKQIKFKIWGIMTSSQDEYNSIRKTTKLLEEMFEVQINHSGLLYKLLGRVLSEKGVPDCIKRPLAKTMCILNKYVQKGSRKSNSKPRYCNRSGSYAERKRYLKK